MNMNFDAYKQEGEALLRAHVTPVKWDSREQVKQLIRNGLDAQNLDGVKRRFIADYCMAQLGFGGGF